MRWRLRLALEIERLLRRTLVRVHPLRQLFWESTLRCNVHCRHCGSDCAGTDTADSASRAALPEEMPAADFLRVLDEEVTPYHTPATVMIIISGGEPLMRRDLCEVGRELRRRGYPWGMVTNGLMLTEARFRELREAGLSSLSISLDGLEEEHVWLRQHPIAFERATAAIRLAVASGLPFDVVTCVHRRNLDSLPALRDMLIGLGVKAWRLVTIDPMGRAANDAELLLPPEGLRQLMTFIRATRHEGRIRASYGCPGFLGEWEGEVRDHLFHCAAGVSAASVLIDGSISACTSIRGKYYQGNIYRDHFHEVWEKGFRPYRDRRWMREQTPCNDCALWRYCEGSGMHLRREDGTLMRCHHRDLQAS